MIELKGYERASFKYKIFKMDFFRSAVRECAQKGGLSSICMEMRAWQVGFKTSNNMYSVKLVIAAVIERNFENSELYLVLLLMGREAFHDMPQYLHSRLILLLDLL